MAAGSSAAWAEQLIVAGLADADVAELADARGPGDRHERMWVLVVRRIQQGFQADEL